MKELLLEVLWEQQQYFASKALPRAVQLDPDLLKVQVITGPRRAGKSSLLKLTIDALLRAGVPWNRICYLPLEDERLRTQPFSPDLILQAFRELNPANPLMQEVYFFFDEIQYLQQWEPFINRVHEQVSRKVVITGSNSRTLHTEVASVLRGRGLPVELLPLSFAEFLQFRDIAFADYGHAASQVKAAFQEYLINGGYPESLEVGAAKARQLLQEYFNTVLYRDVIEQQQAANFSYLRYLFHRIAANTGKNTALSKIFLELKSRGYAVSKNSIYQMADLAEAVYLFKRIGRFDPSLIKRENADKKSYFIDNGMLRAITGQFSDNKGMLFENAVFWQLYRQYGNMYTTDIYYYKDANHECDFVLYAEGGKALPIQVCWQMDTEETRSREVKGLVKACRITDSKTGIIITSETEEDIIHNEDIHIKVLPAWKWFVRQYDLFGL